MAAKYNITIDQGATFTCVIYLKNAAGAVIPLAGYAARAQLRSKYAAATAVEFTTVVDEVLNSITLSLTAAATAALPAPALNVYDVEIEDLAGTVIRVIEGRASVTPEVTRVVVEEV